MSDGADRSAALTERLQPLLTWIARQHDPVTLELACAEHPSPQRGTKGRSVVVLPGCVTQLPEHLLLELLDLGAEQVWVRTDGCDEPEAARALVGWIEQVLTALGDGGRVRVEAEPRRPRHRHVLDATVMAVSRRRLLMLPEPEVRATPDPRASAHLRLVAALRALAGDRTAAAGGAEDPADRLTGLAGPGLALVSEGCTACGVCVRACPEEALALVDVSETGADGLTVTRTVLRQQPAACGGAGDCLELCPEDALSAPQGWSLGALLADDAVDLDAILKARCRRCGATFPDRGDELCDVCASREANPFGAALPPGVAARLDPAVVRRLEGR